MARSVASAHTGVMRLQSAMSKPMAKRLEGVLIMVRMSSKDLASLASQVYVTAVQVDPPLSEHLTSPDG
jgi:hypothetical protein